jgi:hypothetical protein
MKNVSNRLLGTLGSKIILEIWHQVSTQVDNTVYRRTSTYSSHNRQVMLQIKRHFKT